MRCWIRNRKSEPKLALNTGRLLFLSLLVNKKSAKKKKREKKTEAVSFCVLFRPTRHSPQRIKEGYRTCHLCTSFLGGAQWLNVFCSVRSNAYTVTFPFKNYPCHPASISWHTHRAMLVVLWIFLKVDSLCHPPLWIHQIRCHLWSSLNLDLR